MLVKRIDADVGVSNPDGTGFGNGSITLALAGATVTFYLGGWLGPWLPPWAWSAIKIMLVAAAMLGVGRYMPRIREARYLALSWKLGISLALANIFIVGVIALVVPI